MNKPNNPAAFPVAIMTRQADGMPLTGHDFGCGGMDLRDYFAAKAMQALMSTPEGAHVWEDDKIAEWAYSAADAMLKRREES